uniref:ATP synthase complex subunit 8 n=1 Tax=Tarsipes rostratus TaxID=38632 RepID=Q5QS75_TARRO|nr:ATP synthase F0 subunit 8 [Tarsipes rostratus]CAG26372.1 ATP synthase F0 subunit 8 [Tarsipes rostratus]
MPQLDTSTWFLTIILMVISLFCIYQLKMLNQPMNSITPTSEKEMCTTPTTQPHWNSKWTKIYLPHSSPLRS